MSRSLLLVACLLSGAAPVRAESPSNLVAEPPGSRFVACDNGLRCVKAPCPSRSAVNLDTGEVTRGVDFDLHGLTPEDRAGLQEAMALYYGRTILEAQIQTRAHGPHAPGAGRSPLLVATAVLGPATPEQAAQCRRGGGFAPPRSE